MNESESRTPEPTPNLEERASAYGIAWVTFAVYEQAIAERDRLRAEVERLRAGLLAVAAFSKNEKVHDLVDAALRSTEEDAEGS